LETLTKLIAGTPATAFTGAEEALQKLRHVEGLAVATAAVYNSARLAWFAKAMTWWTLLIESAIAITFLAPRRFALSKLRDAFLLIFLITTYTSATVVGFGWVLAIMGFAQCSGEAQWRRRLYILAFVLIFLYTGPWSDFISGLLSKVTGNHAAVSP
jgi:hypothetical protein